MYIYAYYDAEGNLLYIGSTRHMLNRFQQHKKENKWMSQAVSIAMWGPYNQHEGLLCEKVLIAQNNPLYNTNMADNYRYEDAPILYQKPITFENYDAMAQHFSKEPGALKRCTFYLLNEDDEALRWLSFYSGETISELVRTLLRKAILEKAKGIDHPNIYEEVRSHLRKV